MGQKINPQDRKPVDTVEPKSDDDWQFMAVMIALVLLVLIFMACLSCLIELKAIRKELSRRETHALDIPAYTNERLGPELTPIIHKRECLGVQEDANEE
jgi:hypothetical protein